MDLFNLFQSGEDPFSMRIPAMNNVSQMVQSLMMNPLGSLASMDPLGRGIMGMNRQTILVPGGIHPPVPSNPWMDMYSPGIGSSIQTMSMLSGDPSVHSYCSSTMMSMTTGPDGRPMVYQATSSTRAGPGGICETQKSVLDNVTGTKKMQIGRHIGDRGHIIEKEQNMFSGEREEREDFINIEEDEAEEFTEEFENKARYNYGGQRPYTARVPAITSQQTEPKKALPEMPPLLGPFPSGGRSPSQTQWSESSRGSSNQYRNGDVSEDEVEILEEGVGGNLSNVPRNSYQGRLSELNCGQENIITRMGPDNPPVARKRDCEASSASTREWNKEYMGLEENEYQDEVEEASSVEDQGEDNGVEIIGEILQGDGIRYEDNVNKINSGNPPVSRKRMHCEMTGTSERWNVEEFDETDNDDEYRDGEEENSGCEGEGTSNDYVEEIEEVPKSSCTPKLVNVSYRDGVLSKRNISSAPPLLEKKICIETAPSGSWNKHGLNWKACQEGYVRASRNPYRPRRDYGRTNGDPHELRRIRHGQPRRGKDQALGRWN